MVANADALPSSTALPRPRSVPGSYHTTSDGERSSYIGLVAIPLSSARRALVRARVAADMALVCPGIERAVLAFRHIIVRQRCGKDPGGQEGNGDDKLEHYEALKTWALYAGRGGLLSVRR